MTSVNRTNTNLRRRTVLAATIAVIGLAGAVNAWADPDPVDLQVVDRGTGQALPVWRHRGRLFVAGEPGARYGLRVTNHTDGRVMAVMSVDGVNILTGETASIDQRGYVFDAHESSDVNGWRKSTTEVAAFTFAPLPQSYAARTGRPGEVGIIGMAVFTERVPFQARVRAPLPVAPQIRPQRRDQSSRTSRAVPAPAPPVAAPLNIPAPPSLLISPVEGPRPIAPAPAP